MSVFDDLAEEWQRVGQCSAARRAIRQWATQDECLEQFEDLSAVVRFGWSKPDPDAVDAVLAALVRRAADEPLAARCVLQCMTPGLICVARQYQYAAGPDEAAAMVLAAGYEHIVKYPFERRPRKIAANLIGDTRQSVSRSLFRRRVEEVLVEEPRTQAPTAEPSATIELRELLEELQARGRISASDVHLITSTRIAGFEIREVARAMFMKPKTVAKRRERAEAEIAAACAGLGARG